MRKSMLRNVVVMMVLLMIAGGSVFADFTEQNGNLQLKGTVLERWELTVFSNDNTDNIPLYCDTGNEELREIIVGALKWKSNCPSGYDISIRSQKDGNLGSGTNMVPYKIRIEGYGIHEPKSSKVAIISDQISPTPSNGIVKKVSVLYDCGNYFAGEYTDSLYFYLNKH